MLNVEANQEVLTLKKSQGLQGPLPEFKLYFLGKGLRFDGARMNTDQLVEWLARRVQMPTRGIKEHQELIDILA
jgi:hypothetical protein